MPGPKDSEPRRVVLVGKPGWRVGVGARGLLSAAAAVLELMREGMGLPAAAAPELA